MFGGEWEMFGGEWEIFRGKNKIFKEERGQALRGKRGESFPNSEVSGRRSMVAEEATWYLIFIQYMYIVYMFVYTLVMYCILNRIRKPYLIILMDSCPFFYFDAGISIFPYSL